MKDFFGLLMVWLVKLSIAVMAVVQFLIFVSEQFVSFILQMTEWAFAEVATLAVPDWEFNLSDYEQTLSLANHFFPIAEGFVMLIVGVPFMVFIVLYRFIKSWIPTIAN